MNKCDPVVSVCCISYNHARFIRRSLESVVCQKTNFKFEIIIHDDASTDGTIEIIEEFQKKYPNIVTIFEPQNVTSQGKNFHNILKEKIRGKYVAFLETDDYFCDEYKLQKQFDFMENHPDCSMCVHNSRIYDLNKRKFIGVFNKNDTIYQISLQDVLTQWSFQTSSIFIKKEFAFFPEHFHEFKYYGDFKRVLWCLSQGKVYYLPDIMSVYNKNVPNSALSKTARNLERDLFLQQERIRFLNYYDKWTSFKFSNEIKHSVDVQQANLDFDSLFLDNISKEQYYLIRNRIVHSSLYSAFLKSFSFKGRFVRRIVLWNFPWFCFIKFLKRMRNHLRSTKTS